MNLEQYFPYFLLTFTQQLVYKNLVILNYIYPIDVESDVEVVGMKIDACLFFHYTCGMPEENGDTGAICTSSGRFKHIEPHRTFSNYILTEIARYIEFFHMSSGWFDCTEPSPTTISSGDTRCAGCNMH